MKRAIYTGSFDPFTNGHLDILNRGLNIFDEITILIAGTNRKKTLLSTEERRDLIQSIIGKLGNKVKVDVTDGLVMDYAQSKGIHAVIRGLRGPTDFEYETMMASMNKNIHPNVETVFMMTSQGLNFVSSTMIKELFAYGGDISPYVPAEVVKKMQSIRGRM